MKLIGIVLILLPIAILTLIVMFKYGTFVILEITGLLALGIVFMLVSMLCVWIGTMLLKIQDFG